MLRRLFSRPPEPNIIEKNKKLLNRVKYIVEYRGEDIWTMKAYEKRTGADVVITVYNSFDEYKNVDYWSFVPGANFEFKMYIKTISAGDSKGLVRVMLCKLVRMALRKFHVRVKPSDRICLWACGDGPTGDYKDLIRMYRSMGFKPVGTTKTYRDGALYYLQLLQEALNDESKFNDTEFMKNLYCEIVLEQSISSLLGWCRGYESSY